MLIHGKGNWSIVMEYLLFPDGSCRLSCMRLALSVEKLVQPSQMRRMRRKGIRLLGLATTGKEQS